MKRLFALTVVLSGLIGLTQIAFAGPERLEAKEMKQIAPAPPPCDWTGFYIGIHGGWRGGENEWNEREDTSRDLQLRETINGGFGGLEIGYNRQFGQWFVLGFELTGAYGSPDEDTSYEVFNGGGRFETKHFHTQNDWSGTFALRAGFTTLNNKLLIFGKFGGAVTHWNYDYVNDETFDNSIGRPEFDRWSEEETRISPLVGAGFEYAFNCHWSAKVEWNHIFLGAQTVTGVLHEDFEPNDPNHGYSIDLTQDSAFVGLNYKF
jgi:outer membrane immunogenic protein